MSEPRLTNMLIGVIFVGLLISGMAIFLTGAADTYGGDTDDINDNFTAVFVNESRSTTSKLETARGDLTSVQEDKTLLDRLGSFFRSGYDSAKALINSVDSLTRLINKSVQQIPFLGAFGTTLATSLSIMVLIIIVGIFLHFLIKSERI